MQGYKIKVRFMVIPTKYYDGTEKGMREAEKHSFYITTKDFTSPEDAMEHYRSEYPADQFDFDDLMWEERYTTKAYIIIDGYDGEMPTRRYVDLPVSKDSGLIYERCLKSIYDRLVVKYPEAYVEAHMEDNKKNRRCVSDDWQAKQTFYEMAAYQNR